ncbi:TetR/AcrR family transcriptional regulator [Streptomyces griseoincarnatus]
MEVGSCNDAEIQAVLSALWSAADVHGCFGLRDREPEEQDPVPCTVGSLAEFGHLLGQVRLLTGALVVCGCVAIRGGDESSDWLDFYVPAGALDKAGLAGVRSGWISDPGGHASPGVAGAEAALGQDLAAKLLEEGGSEAVSARAVAAAGITAPALYRMFDDKDRLLTELAAYGFEMYLAEKREALPLAPDDPVADLYRGWDLHVGFGVRHPAFYMLMYGTVQPGRCPPAADEAHSLLVTLLGRARPPPWPTASVFCGKPSERPHRTGRLAADRGAGRKPVGALE